MPEGPQHWRLQGWSQHPTLDWRAGVPLRACVPLFLLAWVSRWRVPWVLLLLVVPLWLAAMPVPLFGLIEQPRGGLQPHAAALRVVSACLILGPCLIAAGGRLCRWEGAERRARLALAAGGTLLLTALLMPSPGGGTWGLNATRPPEYTTGGISTLVSEAKVRRVFADARKARTPWAWHHAALGGIVAAYGVLALVLAVRPSPALASTVRWWPLVLLIASGTLTAVAFELAPLYRPTGSHSAPVTLSWWSASRAGTAQTLLLLGQLAPIAVGLTCALASGAGAQNEARAQAA